MNRIYDTEEINLAESSQIRLKVASNSQRDLLFNLNQKYLYEMTQYYFDEMDENGNYEYGYFDLYFTEKERHALFICLEDTTIGFALLNPYSYIGQKPDMVIGEFTIFPQYRRNGYGEEAARQILLAFGKSWEIKFNEKNKAAKSLWEKVTRDYCPTRHKLTDDETVLSFRTDAC